MRPVEVPLLNFFIPSLVRNRVSMAMFLCVLKSDDYLRDESIGGCPFRVANIGRIDVKFTIALAFKLGAIEYWPLQEFAPATKWIPNGIPMENLNWNSHGCRSKLLQRHPLF